MNKGLFQTEHFRHSRDNGNLKLHSRSRKNYLPWIVISLIILGMDQLVKFLIIKHIPYGESIYIAPFFNIVSMRNPGAAFSFLAAQPGWQNWLFAIITMIVCILIINWLAKLPRTRKLMLPLGLVLILGGALGNLGDRILHGYVIDFLDFHIGIWHWPAFNIADSAIVIGTGLILLSLCLRKT